MKEYWVLTNVPLPPTVNRIYENRSVMKRVNGSMRVRTSRRHSDDMTEYIHRLQEYTSRNLNELRKIHADLRQVIERGDQLMVEAYFVVHGPLMLTKPKRKEGNRIDPKGIDANNYVKAAIDGLTRHLIHVDDRHVLRGSYEKISCHKEEEQCAVYRITPHRIRDYQTLIGTVTAN